MRMVVSLAFDQFHGVVSGHGSARRPLHGIEVGFIGLIHHVLGELLALVQDDQTFAFGFLNGKSAAIKVEAKPEKVTRMRIRDARIMSNRVVAERFTSTPFSEN